MKSAVALALALTAMGCTQWRPISLDAVRAGRFDLQAERARFTGAEGTRDVDVSVRVGPFAQGLDRETGRGVRVDLDLVRRVEVRRPDHLLNALIVGGIYVSVFALGALTFADGLPPLFGDR